MQSQQGLRNRRPYTAIVEALNVQGLHVYHTSQRQTPWQVQSVRGHFLSWCSSRGEGELLLPLQNCVTSQSARQYSEGKRNTPTCQQ
jgi:hypothetical protein